MTSDAVGLVLVGIPVLLFGYAYVGYPMLLKVWGWFVPSRPGADRDDGGSNWPDITITIPAYNEANSIAETLDRVLRLSYPTDRRQVLVISDASTDDTDTVVESFGDRGVELIRLPERGGKSAAENAAVPACRGTIVVNIDATVVIRAGALEALIGTFRDPSVGVASGRDVSVGDESMEQNFGESGYVGYEMMVRRLETRAGSIVGASGCFYATRRKLQDPEFPESLSRDFAAAMIARERGFRAVSVEGAVCFVPRTALLHTEYRRKVRTMARGLRTLWYKRRLMNPFRYGGFAVMLLSHKLARWLVPLTTPLALIGLAVLAMSHRALWLPFAGIVVALVIGYGILRQPPERSHGKLATALGYAVASVAAGVMAWIQILVGRRHEVWEPTRRTESHGAGGATGLP